jgi:DNA helicase-2/ATP-dependent DNA helicase PcrA
MRTLDAAHHGRNSAAHSDDLRALVALGHVHPDAPTFHTWLHSALRPDDTDDGITLATVHRVKGLEWPHVIVYDATAGIFPHRLSTDIEEERRVFHVAITRARQSLQIVTDESSPSIFLEELITARSPSTQVPGPPRSQPQLRANSHTKSEGPSATATIGLVFSWGGYDCTVSTISDAGVGVSIGTSTVTVPYGSKVTIAGRAAVLSQAVNGSTRREATGSTEADPAVVAALKSWRLERARRDGVPAYVVFDDKTLEAIVVAMPSTESEMLAVLGIGPKRVELYGNEVLALLDTTRAAP